MSSSTTVPSSAVPSLTAHLNSSSSPEEEDDYTPPSGAHLGRDRSSLSPEAWERIDRAVHFEQKRSRLVAKYLPVHKVEPHVTTVQADVVLNTINGQPLSTSPASAIGVARANPLISPTNPAQLNIDDTVFLKVLEPSVEHVLTHAQMDQENRISEAASAGKGTEPKPGKLRSHSTAVTLSLNATRLVCHLEDQLAFQGLNASTSAPLIANGYAQLRGTSSDYGLLSCGPANDPNNFDPSQVVAVPQTAPTAPDTRAQWSYKHVDAFNTAIGILNLNGHYGPFVAFVPFYVWSDIWNPIGSTPLRAADLIVPQIANGIWASLALPAVPNPTSSFGTTPALNNAISPTGAGAVPQQGSTVSPPTSPATYITNPLYAGTQAIGIVLSHGGDTVDLVVGQEPVTAFSQINAAGFVAHRVFSRSCIRFKDRTAGVRLEYQ
jgi:hypothetical protein